MQQTSYVILIDIDNLIVKPCFPLFPEWGESLFVASMGDKQEVWQTIDYLLSMREVTDIHLSIWLLSENGLSLDEIVGKENFSHLPYVSTTLSHIKRIKATYSDVDVFSIIYKYLSDIEEFNTSSKGDVQLLTRFEYPLLQNDELLSKQWLLPMALRALLHQSKLLHRKLTRLRRIELISNEEQLLSLITENSVALKGFSEHLHNKQKVLKENIGKLPIFILNNKKDVLNVSFNLEEIDETPYFYPTYSPIDEENIRNWVRQIDPYPGQLKHYNKLCHAAYLRILPQLYHSGLLSQQSATEWLKVGSVNTHDNILQPLTQESQRLEAQRKTTHFNLSPSDNFSQFSAIEGEKNSKRSDLEEFLINSCRNRPTRNSLITLLAIPTILMTASLFVGEGKGSFVGAIPYGNLLGFSTGIGAVWLGIVAFKIWRVNRRFKEDCKLVQTQLTDFRQRMIMNAGSINYLANNLLAGTVSNHNKDKVINDEKKYQSNMDKIQYHLTEISRHLKEYSNTSSEVNAPTKKPILPEVDIEKPVEQQPAYFWLDDEILPEIYEGKSRIDLNGTSKEYVRYPSIKKIIFLG